MNRPSEAMELRLPFWALADGDVGIFYVTAFLSILFV